MLVILAAYAGCYLLVFLDILAGWLGWPAGYAGYACWFSMLAMLYCMVA
jgi:hypothetical protein